MNLTFMCLNVGDKSPLHVGPLTASKDDLVAALDEHVKLDPRLAAGAEGSLLIDARVLDGENPDYVRLGVVANLNVMRSRRRHQRKAASR